MLGSRRVEPCLVEDIVQEVAVRALDKRVPFTDPDDLYRWAATTARRLHIDHLRTDHWTLGEEQLLAVADGTDVAHTAERRVALDQVIRALAVMRPRERDAILESLEEREARSPQMLVRRHRARATLRKAVGSVLGAAWLARLRLRVSAPAFAEVAAAAALAPALALGAAATLPSGDDVPLRAPRVASAPAADRPEAVTPEPAPRALRAPRRPAPPPAAPARAAGRRPGAPASGPEGRETGERVAEADVDEVGELVVDEHEDAREPLVCVGNGPTELWCAQRPGEHL